MDELTFGIVVDIDDPSKVQRVKVRVFGYYDDLPESDLPWCQVLRCGASALTFNVGVAMHNLEKGTQVLCGWLDHYHQQPIVLGCVPRISDCDQLSNTSVERITTKQGHVIQMDDDMIDIEDNLGNHVTLDSRGVTIEIPKNLANDGNANIKIDNELNVTVTKMNVEATDCSIKCTNSSLEATDCNIKASGKVNIEAADCNIKASGNTVIDASKLSMKNIQGPNQFCCLPTCLFSGAKHTAPSTD